MLTVQLKIKRVQPKLWVTDKKRILIYGTSGEDVIYGGDGADVIYGGDGNDTLQGGNNGDSLYGQAGKDYLQGGDGNDYLNGGADADIMRGGDGNDVYFVDHKGDEVIEYGNLNGGIDTVRTVIDYTLTDNVENLFLQGMQDLNGTGNSLNNNTKVTAATTICTVWPAMTAWLVKTVTTTSTAALAMMS